MMIPHYTLVLKLFVLESSLIHSMIVELSTRFTIELITKVSQCNLAAVLSTIGISLNDIAR